MNQEELRQTFIDAVKNNSYADIVKCIEQGVDANTAIEHGWSALHYASERGANTIVEYLIEHGANVDQLTNRNRTALQLAANNGHVHIIELLIYRHADVNLKNDSGNTALHLATFNKLEDCAKLLLQGGADIRIENMYGETALDIAYKDPKMADLLSAAAENNKLNALIDNDNNSDIQNLGF